MVQKKKTRHSGRFGHQIGDGGYSLLFTVGVLFVISLVLILSTFGFKENLEEANEPDEIAFYNNTLAMEYAQPWLEGMETAVAPAQYSNALAMQYAQPWLEQSINRASPNLTYQDFLAIFYADPWVNAAKIEYNDALAMQYAQPWLDKDEAHWCNGRLDRMYACKYGYQP